MHNSLKMGGAWVAGLLLVLCCGCGDDSAARDAGAGLDRALDRSGQGPEASSPDLPAPDLGNRRDRALADLPGTVADTAVASPDTSVASPDTAVASPDTAVASPDTAVAKGDSSGGVCFSNGDCTPLGTTYCSWATGCGAGGAGVCKVRPGICTSLYAPVCGCDNKTYSNACVAAAAGQSVLYSGPC